MRILWRALALATLIGTSTQGGAEDRAGQWWSHVQILASDGNEGRATGSPGHERAAA